MSKTKTPSRATHALSGKKTIKAQSQALKPPTKKAKEAAKSKRPGSRRAGTKKSDSTQALPQIVKAAAASPGELLIRAESGITAAIETMNHHMNAAIGALTELASTHGERHKAIVRTAPLDRATAMFQRLVADVLDDQLGEMLPPLIALRNEMAQGMVEQTNMDSTEDFRNRAVQTLDHVLALAGVQTYGACIGETFDPLVHLAVGETHREDLEAGVVTEQLQPGFRSARGKIMVSARVRINRR